MAAADNPWLWILIPRLVGIDLYRVRKADAAVGRKLPPYEILDKFLVCWCREGESNPHEVALGGF